MTKVTDKVIEKCQLAFMGGRQILDVALIDNDVVDELVSKKREKVL